MDLPFLPLLWQDLAAHLAACLHQRHAWRLTVLLLGALFAKGRRTVTSWLSPLTSVPASPPSTTSWPPSDAAPTASPDSCSVPPCPGWPRTGHCCSPSTIAPRSATVATFRALACTTTPRPERRTKSSFMATFGSPWPGSSFIPCGTPWACRCSLGFTFGARTSPVSPSDRVGRFTPSWNWPPTWSAGRPLGSALRAGPCASWPTAFTPSDPSSRRPRRPGSPSSVGCAATPACARCRCRRGAADDGDAPRCTGRAVSAWPRRRAQAGLAGGAHTSVPASA